MKTNKQGEVLILKVVDKDGRSFGGFLWPSTVGARVVPHAWSKVPSCDSGGLFGWAWGDNIGYGKVPTFNEGKWIVFGARPEDVVVLEETKVKARTGFIRCVGTFEECIAFMLPQYCKVKKKKISLKDFIEKLHFNAVKVRAKDIVYITNPCEKVQLHVISIYSNYIKYITNPCEKVQLQAVLINSTNLDYIKKPTKKVLALHKKLRKCP